MQKENTKSKAVTSSKRRKVDSLPPYEKQARSFIDLYFGDDTPSFVRDLLSEWYSRLEEQTQVFWNDRRIAEIALPLMLEAADNMGIDVDATCSDFMSEVAGSWSSGIERKVDRYGDNEPLTERQELMRELEKDAEAISRIMNSPHIPAEIHNALCDPLGNLAAPLHRNPDVLRVQYPLAMLKYMKEEAESESNPPEVKHLAVVS